MISGRKFTCPWCGKEYLMGYDGTCDGCDTCLGIERDMNGEAWRLGQMYKSKYDIFTKIQWLADRGRAFFGLN